MAWAQPFPFQPSKLGQSANDSGLSDPMRRRVDHGLRNASFQCVNVRPSLLQPTGRQIFGDRFRHHLNLLSVAEVRGSGLWSRKSSRSGPSGRISRLGIGGLKSDRKGFGLVAGLAFRLATAMGTMPRHSG